MSTDAAVRFAELLATDQDFQQRVAEAVEGTHGSEATDAVVRFASAEGLEITSDELLAVQGALVSVELSEESLDGVAGGLTLSDIDLQRALQEQQQTIQTLSNVSKMTHDTAMSIIRKIG